jgi:NAD(P)-dependent dehydrogenase (short-subunit alcohol dehydrogenase family)
MSKVWFITGASSGFGRSLAEEALALGYSVAATARNTDALAKLVAQAPDRAVAIRLDVTRPEEIAAAVETTLARFGRLDVAVNNAGYGLIGALEEVSEAEIKQMFDTHVFGTMGVIRAALPHMRRQRSGTIINVSSIGGLIGYYGGSIYNACKFAMEGMTEALVEEVRPFGIKVMLLEPGTFRTDFFNRSIRFATPMAAYDGTPVGERRGMVGDAAEDAPGPEVVAQAILKAEARDDLPLRLMVGADVLQGAQAKIDSLTHALEVSKVLSGA